MQSVQLNQKHVRMRFQQKLVVMQERSPSMLRRTTQHSLGTFPERDLFHRQELQGERVVGNDVEKYIFIAPQPDLIRERAHGLTLALPFMLDGMKTMATNHQILLPGKRATHFYFNTHSPEEQEWLLGMTQDQWPVTYLNYSALLLGVMREPLIREIGQHPKLEFVLMDQDNVFPTFRNEDFWQEHALVLSGDHSTIAGRSVDPQYVDAIAALIED